MKTVVVVGAGAVGCAVAYELARTGLYEVLVVERNDAVTGENQSSRNSGVVHAGIYYEAAREPLKARLCVRGNAMLYDFCAQHGVPCLKCGKLVVANNGSEAGYLDAVIKTAGENGVPGVRMIGADEVRGMEPDVAAAAGALYVPSSGIVEPTALVRKLAGLAKRDGTLFITGTAVTGIRPAAAGMTVTVTNRDGSEDVACDYVVNAAGLYADEVARLLDPAAPYRLAPVRGESAQFRRNARYGLRLNGMNVYPAPYCYDNDTGERVDVTYAESLRLLDEGRVSKTVGIHLTPTFDADGSGIGPVATIGPAKTPGTGREDYGTGLKPSGYYPPRIMHYFPGIRQDDCGLYQAGIMAVRADGPDWIIERDPGHPCVIQLVGIDSPGLTACLAVAGRVKELIEGT